VNFLSYNKNLDFSIQNEFVWHGKRQIRKSHESEFQKNIDSHSRIQNYQVQLSLSFSHLQTFTLLKWHIGIVRSIVYLLFTTVGQIPIETWLAVTHFLVFSFLGFFLSIFVSHNKIVSLSVWFQKIILDDNFSDDSSTSCVGRLSGVTVVCSVDNVVERHLNVMRRRLRLLRSVVFHVVGVRHAAHVPVRRI
jgi:hypothetical protein